ncbi:interleukin 12Ba isoform X2 [Boleophthalmus pectinirostris]|uniref:interleukin 12Ba isoform X2 n=1 Tax=Boleophthalmus pectinirostris TaxID=150288 RepID=UPI00242F4547|nr:interleukin 12Ba isoform X2 [Boleophthalmus pectinirostris]
MMLAFFTLWSLLHITSQNPTNWTLKDNVLEVTGEVGHHLLSCIHSEEEVLSREDKGSGIFWRKNGGKPLSTGNILTITLQESSGGGNYTCHNADGSLLNYTTVLIRADQGKTKRILEPAHIHCSAPNYNGNFQCSWKWHPSRNGKVAWIKVWRNSDNPHDPHDSRCTEDSEGRQWTCLSNHSIISCSVDPDGNSISCTDILHCPYAEEVHFIRITVDVVNDFLVENYSRSFFLSEIVKPGKVQISKVNKTAIEWTYPTSWDSPNSYFPLTFQIIQLKKEKPCNSVKAHRIKTVDCTENCWCKRKSKRNTVCFRAKDALSNSQWSEWSQERISSRKKQKKREKNQEHQTTF